MTRAARCAEWTWTEFTPKAERKTASVGEIREAQRAGAKVAAGNKATATQAAIMAAATGLADRHGFIPTQGDVAAACGKARITVARHWPAVKQALANVSLGPRVKKDLLATARVEDAPVSPPSRPLRPTRLSSLPGSGRPRPALPADLRHALPGVTVHDAVPTAPSLESLRQKDASPVGAKHSLSVVIREPSSAAEAMMAAVTDAATLLSLNLPPNALAVLAAEVDYARHDAIARSWSVDARAMADDERSVRADEWTHRWPDLERLEVILSLVLSLSH